jgi:enoyl-CoA hydratase
MSELVLVERKGRVAIVTLNRPEAMNALSLALRAKIHNSIHDLDADPDIRVIILTGAGDRAFSAGLDLKELGANQGALRHIDGGGNAADPVHAIEQCSKPIIAAVNGVAVTGGFELALACDVIIASHSARFADTHARIGVTPGWGMSQRLSRCIGIGRAKLLSLTGNFLDAETAERWGLVAVLVEPHALREIALKIANDMADTLPGMLVSYKKLIDDGFALNFGEAMVLEDELSATANSALDAATLNLRKEAVFARGRLQ